MSQFKCLVLALPLDRVGILAQQAGITPPTTINLDDVHVEGSPTQTLLTP